MPSAWMETKKNKHGKNYLVRWEIMPGVRGSENCGPSKAHALTRKNEIRESLYAGKPIKAKAVMTSAAQFASEYLSNSQKTKALKTYKNFDKPVVEHFAAWYKNTPISMVDASVLAAWRDKLIEEGREPNGVIIWLSTLSSAFGWAVGRGLIERNPFDHSRKALFPKPVDVARLLTESEVSKLFAHLARRHAEALYFILRTGLRHEELITLDWKVIQRPKAGPWLMSVCSKTGQAGDVEIDQKAIEVMGAPADSGKVFQWTTRTGIGKALRSACVLSKIGRVRVHDFRHTWSTNFMRASGNIFELLYRGRWKTIKSAAVYQHIRKQGEPSDFQSFSHYFPTNTKDAAKVKNP